jgi:predicted ATP-dependent protease
MTGRATRPPLDPDQLAATCDPASLGFATTDELEDLTEIMGQDRAVEAIRLAIDLPRPGYNIYALGPHGIGKQTTVRSFLDQRAADQPVPDDWCYVFDFERPHRPRALRLPAGRGASLRAAMERLNQELRSALPAVFESEGYRSRRDALDEALKTRREEAFRAVEEQAQALGVAIVRTPLGAGAAPVRDGKVIGPDEFKALPEEEQEQARKAIHAVEEAVESVVHQTPRWEREHRDQVRQLDREMTRLAVHQLIEEIEGAFADLPEVAAYLAAVEVDLTDRAAELMMAIAQAESSGLPARAIPTEVTPLGRYRVNLLVDHAGATGAPVVFEDNPTLGNLIGRVEYTAQLGALVTDFTLIRPGALHRANGGYLVLEGRQVLSQPYAWEALKRALRAAEVRIESLAQAYSLVSTVALEPEPIPIDVKVVLVGDRTLYYLLCQLDPDFVELFRVQADFNEEIDRGPDADRSFARLLATLARRHGIRPLAAAAVARLMDYATRLAGDRDKLSMHIGALRDLLLEAERYAGTNDHPSLTAEDVQAAIDGRERRASRVRDLVLEQIGRGTIRIETSGQRIGQLNGLTVAELGGEAFGWPTRITARVGLGGGEVIDIEREVELGGPLHSKGVMILGGFLSGRYATGRPLSLRASLVFEQSYGPVEGDSASLAELCVLLSALAGAPLHQGLAMTGSVDQNGAVQAIGAVNEKIEGFFDVCARAGLDGTQGVIIPASNVRSLMLRADVIEAVRSGRFRIHAVDQVDEAMELLTGLPAGLARKDGSYPKGSVNARVVDRLSELARAARSFSALGAGGPGGLGGPRRPRGKPAATTRSST